MCTRNFFSLVNTRKLTQLQSSNRESNCELAIFAKRDSDRESYKYKKIGRDNISLYILFLACGKHTETCHQIWYIFSLLCWLITHFMILK